MPNVGPLELVLIAVIALIVLGPQRLPEVARSAGRGMREFKEALSGGGDDDDLLRDDDVPGPDDEPAPGDHPVP